MHHEAIEKLILFSPLLILDIEVAVFSILFCIMPGKIFDKMNSMRSLKDIFGIRRLYGKKGQGTNR